MWQLAAAITGWRRLPGKQVCLWRAEPLPAACCIIRSAQQLVQPIPSESVAFRFGHAQLPVYIQPPSRRSAPPTSILIL